MSPQKRSSPRKKVATPQKRNSPVKNILSPAFKAKRDLIKRKIRQPSRRSLASAFGSPSVGSPMIASELCTESMPSPLGAGSSSTLFPLDADEPVAPARPILNPFKKGSPVKKRRRIDAHPLNAFGSQIEKRPPGSQIPVDWDDETANDSFPSPSTTNIPRKNSIFTRTKSQMDTSSLMSDYALDFSSVLDTSLGSKSGSPLTKFVEEKSSHRLPLDNRLGTKLRITSPLPYPWMTDTAIGQYLVRITGKDQHLGTQLFMQAGFEDIAKPCLSTSGGSKCGVLLTAASSYWQYPSLPWLPLFPRLSMQSKLLKEKVAPPLAPAMLDTINTEWSESIEALFLSWKKGDRHSFYVCCPNITAHFTRIQEDKSVAADESVSCFATSETGLKHAVFITPTTSGFRSYLREQDITVETLDERGKRRLSRTASFRGLLEADESRCSLGGESSRLSLGSMTNETGRLSGGGTFFQLGGEEDSMASKENSINGDMGSRMSLDECTKETEKKPTEDDSEESGDETSPTKMGDAHDWLKTIGVSPASTLRMRRHHTALGRLTTSSNGGGGTPNVPTKRFHREKSDGICTILVKDSASVQALYNLLLTDKAVRAIAGLHAGLPPTLLAAQPFPRSQLQTLKKNSQILKRAGRGVEHVLEIEGGPIMPHTAQLAVEFARAILRDSDTSTAPGAAIHIRVNDRHGYSGLNSLLDEETGCDWTEMNVTIEGECRWKPGAS